MTTQRDRVLEYLLDGGILTDYNGIKIGVGAVRSRVSELIRRGAISNLELQVEYKLIPSQKINGKVVERAVKYIADFCYKENGETVVEDVKGCKKGNAYEIFKIKRKLMLERYGIRVREV